MDGRHSQMISEEDERLIGALLLERDELDRQRAAITNEAIAEKFGVARMTVSKVRRRMEEVREGLNESTRRIAQSHAARQAGRGRHV